LPIASLLNSWSTACKIKMQEPNNLETTIVVTETPNPRA
jgi:hypothetical protein